MRPVRHPRWTMALFMVVCAWLLSAAAQDLRDPTLPPWGSGLSDGRVGGAAPVRGIQGPLSVMVVNGQHYLVVGTRLYSEGQKLDETRIERITETEVWLREGRVLRKISNFVGVQRRDVSNTAAAPACSASAPRSATASRASKNPAPVAACDSGQP